MSLPRESDRFFAVYDRKGHCVAVDLSSDAAVEAARERLDRNTVQEVMNAHSVVQVGRDAYEQHLRGL